MTIEFAVVACLLSLPVYCLNLLLQMYDPSEDDFLICRTVKMESVGHSLSYCPVCSLEYGSSPERVPRLLPCTHSVCHRCVCSKLYRDDENCLDCPVCSINHDFTGTDAIPENTYILKYIQEKKNLNEIKVQCLRHKREKNLFCNEPGCQIAVCGLCLKTDHLNHDWDDLQQVEEKQRQIILQEIDTFEKEMNKNRIVINSVKDENDRRMKICAEKIETERAKQQKKLNNAFDQFHREIGEMKEEVDTKLSDSLALLNRASNKISDIARENRDIISGSVDRLNSVRDLKMKINGVLKELQSYTYYKCSDQDQGEESSLADVIKLQLTLVEFEEFNDLVIEEDTEVEIKEETTGSECNAIEEPEAVNKAVDDADSDSSCDVPIKKRKRRVTSSKNGE